MNGEDKDNEDLYNGLDGDNSGYLDVEGEQDGNGYDDLAGGKTGVGGGGYGDVDGGGGGYYDTENTDDFYDDLYK